VLQVRRAGKNVQQRACDQLNCLSAEMPLEFVGIEVCEWGRPSCASEVPTNIARREGGVAVESYPILPASQDLGGSAKPGVVEVTS
jgi:hypothetical protein